MLLQSIPDYTTICAGTEGQGGVGLTVETGGKGEGRGSG